MRFQHRSNPNYTAAYLFTLPAPAPHQYIVLVARDGNLEFLEYDLKASGLVHKTTDVVHHGRVARLARTLIRLPETVPFQERPERDVIPSVEIHANRPERIKNKQHAQWDLVTTSSITKNTELK